MLRPAPEPAARDCKAPRDAMGLTEELQLEEGEEPIQENSISDESLKSCSHFGRCSKDHTRTHTHTHCWECVLVYLSWLVHLVGCWMSSWHWSLWPRLV